MRSRCELVTRDSLLVTWNGRWAFFSNLLSSAVFLLRIVPEPGQFLLEGHFEKPGRPVSLFGNDDLRHVPVLIRLGMIEFVAVNEGDHIGILLDGTAFAKIRKL